MDHFSKPLKQKYSITLDPVIAQVIQEYADETNRSFSGYINYILQKHIHAVKSGEEKVILSHLSL